jgi:3-oxoadipate CoA-transferase alpha subunit
MEYGLKADFTLIKCRSADRYGNLIYSKTARNFSPIMAMAATTTIVQAGSIVEAGTLDPEAVVTPGIFVDRVIGVAKPLQESALVREGKSYPQKVET